MCSGSAGVETKMRRLASKLAERVGGLAVGVYFDDPVVQSSLSQQHQLVLHLTSIFVY